MEALKEEPGKTHGETVDRLINNASLEQQEGSSETGVRFVPDRTAVKWVREFRAFENGKRKQTVHSRQKRSWLWNQFFVIEEYRGPEPVLIGRPLKSHTVRSWHLRHVPFALLTCSTFGGTVSQHVEVSWMIFFSHDAPVPIPGVEERGRGVTAIKISGGTGPLTEKNRTKQGLNHR
ncbi:hypothetical protein WMY93_031004 [Mugilogobius chulae]|uniref:Uncharacterized protein n=1 Tax=Mugilogobius chulae TaxID=88201 RepID=A0AAW0MJP7_9GOBI